MSNKIETIPDIIAEMRESVSFNRRLPSEMEPHFRVLLYGELVVVRSAVADRIENFADRVEAAHKRELGNTQKMRDMLVKAHTMLKVCDWSEDVDRDGVALLMHEIESALAAPLRNCDVGTAEEQVSRHCKMCTIISRNGTRSCDYSKCNKCFAKWAQMPYDKEAK